MFNNKPITLIIASGLMVILIVLTGIWPFFGRSAGFDTARGVPGRIPGNIPQGQFIQGAFPPEGGNFQPGTGTDGGPMVRTFDSKDFSGNVMSLKLMQLLRAAQLGGGVLAALLGIASIIGIFLMKKWGRRMAVAAGIVAVLLTLPGFFQPMFGLLILESVLKIVIAVIVVVLCLLPVSRQQPASV